ncbi:MAG: cation:proton antiporter [Candidatus Omnitrophota bacterium]
MNNSNGLGKTDGVKVVKWLVGAVVLTGIATLIVLRPFPCLICPGFAYSGFFSRALYIVILASALCLYRVWKGPTGADRIVAVDILGIMIIGLCAVLTVCTGRSWYIDIGIAWALQSFISTLALSKYLEGRGFDE